MDIARTYGGVTVKRERDDDKGSRLHIAPLVAAEKY